MLNDFSGTKIFLKCTLLRCLGIFNNEGLPRTRGGFTYPKCQGLSQIFCPVAQ